MARRPIEWAAACAVAAAGAAIAVRAPRPVMPPFLPIGDYPVYDAAASRVLTLVEPVAHAPWLGAMSAPVAAVTAGVVLACLWAAGRRAGATTATAVGAVAAFAARPDLGVPLALGAATLTGAALVWASLAAATGGAGDRRLRSLVCATCAGAALALWPPFVVVAPMLIAGGVALGGWPGAVVAATAAGGFAAGLQLWAAHASTMAGEAVSLMDVWTAVTAALPRGQSPFPWPPLTSAGLPMVLALVGSAVAWHVSARRAAWTAAAVATLVVVAAAPDHWRAEAVRAAYWAAWPLVGVGLAWLVDRAPQRARTAVLLGMTLVLAGSGVLARVRQVETEEPRVFVAALSRALSAATGRDATIVSEDPRVDTALAAWNGGATLSRVRPLPALVAAVEARGRSAFAGPSSRAGLELWGFTFLPGAAVTAPARFEVAAVHRRMQCVDVSARWNELAGLEYTGRLGVHLPRGTGRLDVVVAGSPPLAAHAALADGRPAGRVTSGPATGLSSLPPVLWPGDGRLPDAATTIARLELTAHSDYAIDASLLLGARAPLVGARMVDAGGVATICAAPLPRFDPFDAARADAAVLALDDDAYFAGGWHGAEGAGPAAFRWTAGRAVTLVPSSRSGAVTVAIDARPAARLADGAVTLRVAVNGAPVGAHVLTDTPQTYEWQVPAAIWVDGTNEIALEVSRTARPSDAGSHDTRELGLMVSAIRLRR